MGSLRSPEDLLNDLLNHQKRFAALLSLGRAQYAPAFEQILALMDHPDPQIRWAAVQALGNLRNATALPSLIHALDDSDHWVRAAAARTLGNFHTAAIIAPLIHRLQDTDAGVRAAAAYALGLRGNLLAVEPLSGLLHDAAQNWSCSGQRVSDVARDAIGQIRQRHPDTAAQADEPVSQDWADRVLQNVLELAGADRGYVVMKNPQTGAMEYRAGEKVTSEQITTSEFNVGQSVIEEAARTHEPILTDNASRDARFQGSNSIINFSLRQVIAVPLKSGDEVVGVIYADKRLRDGVLKPDDLSKIAEFTQQAMAPTDEASPSIEYEERQVDTRPMPAPTPITPAASLELPLNESEDAPDGLEGVVSDVEKAAAPADLPDWLRQDVTVAEPAPAAAPTPADVPDWLSSADIEADEIPAWLKSTAEEPLESVFGSPSAPPVPALPAQGNTPDFDNMSPEEIMVWMESLAKRQGANEGFTTSADMAIAEIDPSSVVIDEPGYVPSEGKQKGQKVDTATVPKPAGTAAASEVNFSAYYPADAVANREQGLYVYAHLPNLAPVIENDVKKFREQLGGSIPAPRVAKQSAQLQHGTLITVMPECDELDFEPAAVTKKWNGEWTRFDFAFQPKAEMVGDSLFVRVSITVSGVEIAHIKCPIEVIAQPLQIPADNPLAAAKLATQTARLYHRIFVSYSRKDTQVAEAYRLAQMAIGNDVFMDSYSIRVGEDWRAALARAIDDADIFQLFWSSHAAESENVHDEWDYALKYKCPDQNCTYFIRPVFWDKPMPQPPEPLSHLNFRYVPFALADTDGGE